ncbi:MAG TPA: GspH/FimT family pseudopilin [Dyella sp.]|uniref:GspH/FimT family pseudopilin n=1 Tax=Dyella sp. TaxID=1869338 RepID=UPI002D7848DC|nr:GspH/FimT family pseudopilin [Dyella sp.]HET6553092.1 GspH/FimT family pseudopilin [Dyella sp.]
MHRQGEHLRQRQRGLTLIEQVLTTLIVAILACVAAPALGHLVVRNRLQVAQSDVIAALQQARELAIHTQQRSMLCPSRDGKQCSDEVHWERGWLIGHYRVKQADQLDGSPRSTMNDHERMTIISTAGRRRIRFQANGTAEGSNTSFALCRSGDPRDALLVVVSRAGRIYGKKASPEQALGCANAT